MTEHERRLARMLVITALSLVEAAEALAWAEEKMDEAAAALGTKGARRGAIARHLRAHSAALSNDSEGLRAFLGTARTFICKLMEAEEMGDGAR